jgi:hypothetical protein
MKYFLAIILWTIAAVPFFIWEILVCIWTFRTTGLRETWEGYTNHIHRAYQAACRARRYGKPSKF